MSTKSSADMTHKGFLKKMTSIPIRKNKKHQILFLIEMSFLWHSLIQGSRSEHKNQLKVRWRQWSNPSVTQSRIFICWDSGSCGRLRRIRCLCLWHLFLLIVSEGHKSLLFTGGGKTQTDCGRKRPTHFLLASGVLIVSWLVFSCTHGGPASARACFSLPPTGGWTGMHSNFGEREASYITVSERLAPAAGGVSQKWAQGCFTAGCKIPKWQVNPDMTAVTQCVTSVNYLLHNAL